VGEGYQVQWLEGSRGRWAMARLLYRSAHIRLTTQEGYEVHRQTIEWGKQFSEDRIPEQAVGVDKGTLLIMRWALRSWGRVKILNRFFMGTVLPRLQMDLLPGYRCGAHFMIVADRPPETLQDYLDGGRAMQRFWLTATKLNLQFQPEMTPLIFSGYADSGLRFSENEQACDRAVEVSRELKDIFGQDCVTRGVYMGRVGYGKTPTSRSIRRPLTELMMGAEGNVRESDSAGQRAVDAA